jgi:Na+/H+ antiporter NhaC
VSAAVLLTTHSVVAILTVGELARRLGEAVGLTRYRRANLLDITVCTYPFLLPYFIPPILAASATSAGEAYGVPRVSPFDAGMYNVYSWVLLVIVLVAIVTGYGRSEGVEDK